MNKKQILAFWSIFGGFCLVATLSLNEQGVFVNFNAGSALILIAAYFTVAIFISLFVKTNRDYFK